MILRRRKCAAGPAETPPCLRGQRKTPSPPMIKAAARIAECSSVRRAVAWVVGGRIDGRLLDGASCCLLVSYRPLALQCKLQAAKRNQTAVQAFIS